MPTALEYFSYMFQFQALMCGPVLFYRDYIDFIHGHNFLKHAPSSSVRKLISCGDGLLLVLDK
jgi:hypothetical protein